MPIPSECCNSIFHECIKYKNVTEILIPNFQNIYKIIFLEDNNMIAFKIINKFPRLHNVLEIISLKILLYYLIICMLLENILKYIIHL